MPVGPGPGPGPVQVAGLYAPLFQAQAGFPPGSSSTALPSHVRQSAGWFQAPNLILTLLAAAAFTTPRGPVYAYKPPPPGPAFTFQAPNLLLSTLAQQPAVYPPKVGQHTALPAPAINSPVTFDGPNLILTLLAGQTPAFAPTKTQSVDRPILPTVPPVTFDGANLVLTTLAQTFIFGEQSYELPPPAVLRPVTFDAPNLVITRGAQVAQAPIQPGVTDRPQLAVQQAITFDAPNLIIRVPVVTLSPVQPGSTDRPQLAQARPITFDGPNLLLTTLVQQATVVNKQGSFEVPVRAPFRVHDFIGPNLVLGVFPAPPIGKSSLELAKIPFFAVPDVNYQNRLINLLAPPAATITPVLNYDFSVPQVDPYTQRFNFHQGPNTLILTLLPPAPPPATDQNAGGWEIANIDGGDRIRRKRREEAALQDAIEKEVANLNNPAHGLPIVKGKPVHMTRKEVIGEVLLPDVSTESVDALIEKKRRKKRDDDEFLLLY